MELHVSSNYANFALNQTYNYVDDHLPMPVHIGDTGFHVGGMFINTTSLSIVELEGTSWNASYGPAWLGSGSTWIYITVSL